MTREHQFEAHHGPSSPQCGDTTIKEQTMTTLERIGWWLATLVALVAMAVALGVALVWITTGAAA